MFTRPLNGVKQWLFVLPTLLLVFYATQSILFFFIQWIQWAIWIDIALFFLVHASAIRLRDAGHLDRRFWCMFGIAVVSMVARAIVLPINPLHTWWGAVACSALLTAFINSALMAWRLSRIEMNMWSYHAFQRRQVVTLLIRSASSILRGIIYALYFEMGTMGWIYVSSKCLHAISILAEASRQWACPEFGSHRVDEKGTLDPCPVCLEKVSGRTVTLSGCNHSYCEACLTHMRFSLPHPLTCAMCRRPADLPLFLDEVDSIVPSALFKLL